MTGREVVSALLRGERPARMGVNEFFWDETLIGWLKQGYPQSDNPAEDASYCYLEQLSTEEIPQNPGIYFSLDMNRGCFFQSWFEWLPKPRYSKVIEETADWEITENGAGALLKNFKYRSGVPEHIDFKMRTRKIWEEEYKPYLLKLDKSRVDSSALVKESQSADKLGQFKYLSHYFIWEILRSCLGDFTLYENLLLDPPWILDFSRTYTDFFITHMRYIFENIGVPDGVFLTDDLAYVNGPFCSPKTLEELIFPFYEEYIEFLKSYNVAPLMHSCGGITTIMEPLVSTGIVALHPMERKAGCEPIELAKKYKDQLVFMGGLDVRILESGDKGAIKEAVLELVCGMKSLDARYVFGSDHSISSDVTLDSYNYALDICRENYWY